MADHVTNTKTLPKEIQDRFEIIGDLEGGPRFDIPQYGMFNVDFSQLTIEQAEYLVRRKWKHIREKKAAASEKPKETT